MMNKYIILAAIKFTLRKGNPTCIIVPPKISIMHKNKETNYLKEEINLTSRQEDLPLRVVVHTREAFK